MTPQPKASRPNLNAYACTARGLARIGRYLLMLSAISLVTMPITEHLWNWDRFLQGGRDYELGTLTILLFLCLVLVLSRQCKQSVEAFVSILCKLASDFVDRVTRGLCLPGEMLVSCPELAVAAGAGVYNFPLQI